eukprot:Gb_13277 [translate_table: standard]
MWDSKLAVDILLPWNPTPHRYGHRSEAIDRCTQKMLPRPISSGSLRLTLLCFPLLFEKTLSRKLIALVKKCPVSPVRKPLVGQKARSPQESNKSSGWCQMLNSQSIVHAIDPRADYTKCREVSAPSGLALEFASPHLSLPNLLTEEEQDTEADD